MNKRVLLLLLIVSPFIVVAQDKSDTTETDDWKPGYLLFKNHKDTTSGYLKLDTTSFGYLVTFKFRINKDVKQGTLKIFNSVLQDSLRYFGTGNKRYKYFHFSDLTSPAEQNNFTGFAEMIEEGAITIHKGFSLNPRSSKDTVPTIPVYGGRMAAAVEARTELYYPIYCLKKGNAPTILIATSSITRFIAVYTSTNFMNFKIDENNKEYFIHFISDNAELAEKVKSKYLLFGEIEKYIKEYNQWAKNKKK